MQTTLTKYQDSSNVDGDTTSFSELRGKLSQLWQLYTGGQSMSEHITTSSRATEVLEKVAEIGWNNYRSCCEGKVENARQLWRQSESLLIAAAEIDEAGEKMLLGECKRLLAACDHLVEAEEEILRLMDMGCEYYVFAHQNQELVLQVQT